MVVGLGLKPVNMHTPTNKMRFERFDSDLCPIKKAV